MDGLVSLLIFSGLFYVMMRFGCGAHKVHGHADHDKTKDRNDIDLVCGMKVELTRGYGKMHNKKLYRFCSRICLDKFDVEPGKYINAIHKNGGKSL